MVSNVSQSSSSKEMRILNQWIDGLKEEEKFDCLNNVKEFKIIASKSKRNIYTSFGEFSSDIDILVRNAGKGNSVEQKVAAETLKEDWCKELKEIRVCIDCYYSWLTSEDNENYFTLPCTKPHLLVYLQESKKDGSRWWPAKVLSVNQDHTVNIECFGDHLRADDYKFEQCILYADTEKELRKKAEQAIKSKKKVHKKEFENAFKEVLKYIENVKQKYANSAKQSFVPAPSQGQIITNMSQHLKEMFPAAYAAEDPMAPEDAESQAPLANDQYSDSDDNDGTFDATAPHSPVSQGYESRGYHSDHSDDSNDSAGAKQAQREFRIVKIKSGYSQHNADAQSDNQSQADSTAGTKNCQKETQKRKSNSGVMKKPAAKRLSSTRSGQVNAENEVITIDDDHDYERPSTSSQNDDQPNATKSDGNYKLLLNEFAKISGDIALHDQKKNDLMAQQAIIAAKLERYKKK